MYTVTYWELEKTFEEINRVLFFGQVVDPDFTIENSSPLYANVFLDDEDIFHLNISKVFDREEYFRYVMVLETTMLYLWQQHGKRPDFDDLFEVYMKHAVKKFGDSIADPMGVQLEAST